MTLAIGAESTPLATAAANVHRRPVQLALMTGPSPSQTGSSRVVAVCAGRARWHTVGAKRVRTAFVKDILPDGAHVTPLGIAADEHVFEQHGGPDMALLVYSVDHYPHWRSIGIDLPAAGALGENLTVTGLTEVDVCIGDVLRVGSVLMQVTQPRHPCHKIASIYGRADFTALVQQTGYTGYLMRIVEEGRLAAGDEIELIERADIEVSVAEASRVLYAERDDHDAARLLLGVPGLAASARHSLESRLLAADQMQLEFDPNEGPRR